MSNATHPNWALYNLEILAENLAALRRAVGPNRSIFAALKGNAYGHGALPVARVLYREGLAGFMTGSVEEARALRAAGLKPVVLFAGVLPEEMAEVLEPGLIPTVVDRAGAEAAAAAGSTAKPAAVFVKVDMGLGRLGVPEDEVEDFLEEAWHMPGLHIRGLYSHIPFKDQPGQDWAKGRFQAFDALLARLEARDLLPPVTQAGASSSIAAGLKDHGNAVCAGHLLFGLSPFSDQSVGDISAFKPVLCEIGSRLVQVTAHRQGRDLAIAGAFGIREGRRIGVAPIGVANGLQRPAAGGRPVALVRGRRVPIISVSLEHLTLDLDGLEGAEVGDPVLLLGRDGDEAIELEELAAWSGLSCLDSVLAVSGRLDARYR